MPTVEVISLPPDTIAALARGDLTGANAGSPVPLTAWYAEEAESVHVWRYRAAQLARSPGDADWITGVIWDPELRTAVGQAGFHGPPDEAGMVELGYVVMPSFRRRGYARAAFAVLLDRARREPSVHVFRASIAPGNVASERLAAGFGLVRTGEQWDEEDGLEIIYEVAV